MKAYKKILIIILSLLMLLVFSSCNNITTIKTTTKKKEDSIKTTKEIKTTVLVSSSDNMTSKKEMRKEHIDNEIIYYFDIEIEGLYDIYIDNIATTLDISLQGDDSVYYFDESYKTRIKIITESNSSLYFGTKHFYPGEHKLVISNTDMNEETSIRVEETDIYSHNRMVLSVNWLNSLYKETGYNTEEENFLGYIETTGWQDIWTHCQYLPASMYVARGLENSEYERRVKTIADDLLIAKMYKTSGEVNTIYRARDDVFQVSIESDMPLNKYELWRGNAAFIEEMLNCYKYFNDNKYLDYAISAADYILNNWTTTFIGGDALGKYYTRYTNSSGGGIDIMSLGRCVMALAQMYEVTKEAKYKTAAVKQAELLLYAQKAKYENVDGLFASSVTSDGVLNEFRHGNCYANAMLGLAWVYKITQNEKYKNAIIKGSKVLDSVYSDELGMIIVLDGKFIENNSSTGACYMAGRIGYALFNCAYILDDDTIYKQAERVIEFAFGRNKDNRDLEHQTLGSYYYLTNYYGESNIETSGEMYMAQVCYYYLKNIWKI